MLPISIASPGKQRFAREDRRAGELHSKGYENDKGYRACCPCFRFCCRARGRAGAGDGTSTALGMFNIPAVICCSLARAMMLSKAETIKRAVDAELYFCSEHAFPHEIGRTQKSPARLEYARVSCQSSISRTYDTLVNNAAESLSRRQYPPTAHNWEGCKYRSELRATQPIPPLTPSPDFRAVFVPLPTCVGVPPPAPA
jgi:hypothetical protein